MEAKVHSKSICSCRVLLSPEPSSQVTLLSYIIFYSSFPGLHYLPFVTASLVLSSKLQKKKANLPPVDWTFFTFFLLQLT